ncbi:MAG: metal ABC transporter substrate-binding protein [Phycisphaerae bacterium]|nr:metal ABC transporter substrate-binding protein [Phycisphaerae bacterium]
MSPIRMITMMVLILVLLAGCSKSADSSQRGKPAGLRVLCGTYPVYLFTLGVTAECEGVTVESLLPPGHGCPHDFELSAQDIQRVADADVIILNGLGLDDAFAPAIRKTNPNAKVIIASTTKLGTLGLLPMTPCSHDHDADDDDEEDCDVDCGHDGHGHRAHAHHHDHGPWNPHLFASPRRAARMALEIANGLADVDPSLANTKRLAQNALSYSQRLTALADEMKAALADVPNRKIVTEHAVFDYLARDCGLEIAAVIEEIPGQDPTAAGMQTLIERIQSSGAAVIFVEPNSSSKAGQTLANELRLPVEVLDPVASGPANPPPDYYETQMRKNLATLVRVLKSQ